MCDTIFGNNVKLMLQVHFWRKKNIATASKLLFNFHFDGDNSKTAKRLQCLTPKTETDHKHKYLLKYIVITTTKCTVNLVGVIILYVDINRTKWTTLK